MIHMLLPREIMGEIFEEHTKLEWKAPAIDGRVCRIWRQIVLNTPRAWRYLEISEGEPPRIREWREWLHRSGLATFHIRVTSDSTLDKHINEQTLHELLSGYYTRIATLRLPWGGPSFFETRTFPCLRALEVTRWYSTHSPIRLVRWKSMRKLRFLRLAATETFPLQWSELTRLEVLILSSTTITSLPRHSQSLVTLMLHNVSFEDAISNPVVFPSLTYLSLNGVIGLKPYINAPCLANYDERGDTIRESFSSPLPSLRKYGVYDPSFSDLDQAKWHHLFPNVLRLSIRVVSFLFIAFLASLSSDPHSLPVLRTISARGLSKPFTEEEQRTMKRLAQIRMETYRDFRLCFEKKLPFQIPLFFGEVSYCLSCDYECSDLFSRTRRFISKGCRPEPGHINPPRTPRRHAKNCHRA